MADIELLIKIPEEKYNQIINYYQGSNVRPKDYEIAIINGTPLPKGHGDLIDRSKLVYDCSFSEYGCSNICDCDSCYYHIIKETAINKAPTIIEADKGE